MGVSLGVGVRCDCPWRGAGARAWEKRQGRARRGVPWPEVRQPQARSRGDREGAVAEAPLHEVVDRRLGEFCTAIRRAHAARATRARSARAGDVDSGAEDGVVRGQSAGEGVDAGPGLRPGARGEEGAEVRANADADADAEGGGGAADDPAGAGRTEGGGAEVSEDAEGVSPKASTMVRDAWGQVLRMWTERRFSQARTSLQILGALMRSGSILGAGASLPVIGKVFLLGVPLLATVGVVLRSLFATVAREATVFFPRFVAAVAVLAALFATKSVLETFIATLASRKLMDGQQESVGYLTLEVAGVFFACVIVLELMFQRAATVVLPIAGIALALGAKDLIATMMSGIFLTTSRPFQRGDVVWVDGYAGVVLSQDLRYTVLQVKRAGPPDVENGILCGRDAAVQATTGPSVSTSYGAGEGVHMLVPNSRFVNGGFLVARGRTKSGSDNVDISSIGDASASPSTGS